MPNPYRAESVTQYGIQTPNSHTVLMVTNDLQEAQRALDWIQNGRIVHRTITYGSWQSEHDEHGTTDLAQAG
jgi:hypothetical protein